MSAESGSRAAGNRAGQPMPESPAALEQEIEVRRTRLAATIDELTTRAKPKEIARRGVAGLKARGQAAVSTPDGQPRKERIGAVAGALLVLVTVLVWVRRRR
jgi:hypothetical protein